MCVTPKMIYINIGSNKGDRQALIGRAVALIKEAYPLARAEVSKPYFSQAWGYVSSLEFMNVGVLLHGDTPLQGGPLALLRTLQQIERSICPAPHRNADGSYADRAIDIDLISISGVRLSTPVLILPHPRAHLREFVTEPARELGFNLVSKSS